MENNRLAAEIIGRRVLPYLSSRAFLVGAGSFLLTLLLGRVTLLGGMAPLGMALFLALSMAEVTAIGYPLVGAMVGALLTGPPHWAGVTAPAVYLAVLFVYRLWRARAPGPMDKLLLFGLAELLVMPLFAGDAAGWLRAVAALGLSLLMGGAFYRGLFIIRGVQRRRALLEEEQLCLCLLLGAGALALAGLHAWSFSLSVAALSYICMFAAFSRGLQGVAAAVALAGMLVLGERAEPLFVANLAACTLCAAACKRTGQYGVAAAFCLSAGVIGVYVDGIARHVGLLNGIVAGAAFAFTPRSTMLIMRAAVDAEAREQRRSRTAYTRMQRRTAHSLKVTAQAVEEIAAMLPEEAIAGYEREEERQYVAQAAGHICGECIRRGGCWREPGEALRAVYDMMPEYGRGLRPRAAPPLYSACVHTQALCAAAGQAQAQYRQYCAEARRSGVRSAFARRQMASVGDIMRSLAVQVQADVWQDPELEEAVTQRLDEAGLRCRGVSILRGGGGMTMELTLPLWQVTHRKEVIDCAGRAVGRTLRLIKETKTTKAYVLELEQARPLLAEAGTVTLPMAGSSQSGDCMGKRSLPGGRELFVLSDGMGSGKRARDQSARTVELLMEFYSVGFSRDDTLACVNQMRQGKEDMYATIDAMHLDLNTGEAEFIKCGAPPCFVLRQGRVYSVYGESPPAGILEEAQPAVHRARLHKNDAVVLLTDGTLDALGEDAADEIRLNVGGANTPQDAAEALLSAARARNAADDMSVLVVRVA